MRFGVVSGIGGGMGVLDESGDRRRERGNFGVKLGQGTYAVRGGDALFPNYFGEDLLLLRSAVCPFA